MLIAVRRTRPGTARRLAQKAIPLGLREWVITTTPTTMATYIRIPAAAGRNTITAVGIAYRTAPGRNPSITTRLLDLRATNALLLLPGARGVGAAVSVASIAAGVVALGEAVSADSTVAMVASEVSAVVVGIVVAVALVGGDSVEVASVASAEGSGARSTGEW